MGSGNASFDGIFNMKNLPKIPKETSNSLVLKLNFADLQELHDLDEAVVVSFFDLLHESFVGLLDEVIQVGEALDDVVHQMLLEREAPAFNVVQQGHLERLHASTEPML